LFSQQLQPGMFDRYMYSVQWLSYRCCHAVCPAGKDDAWAVCV